MDVSFQQRVTNILTTPQTEWPVIAGERETTGDLYAKYIALLTAIGPAIMLLGGGLRRAVFTYVVTLGAIYICARVLAWLSPRFQGSGDPIDALKLVGYASTPTSVAGILQLIALVMPIVGSLLTAMVTLVAAVYGVYLYFLGLVPVMKIPADQRVPFVLVSAIVMIVVFVVLSAVLTPFIVGGAILTM